MKNNPEISIVMAAFNSERFINEAISSVIRQTYMNWELIIVDDASTDGTTALIRQYDDNRIITMRNNSNKGVAYCRNKGIKVAKGKWLAFLDSDDIWREDKLELQIQHISNKPDGKLFFTGSGFVLEDGTGIDYVLHVPEKITRKEVLKQNLISCSSVMVDKKTYLKHPMLEIKDIHEDLVSWLNILKEEKFAYGLDMPLLIYRLHRNSKSSNKLKSASMQWNSYKTAGEGLISSGMNMICYAIRGISKYQKME